MFRLLLAAIVTLVTCLGTAVAESRHIYSLCRIQLQTDADLERARLLPLELITVEKEYVEVVIEADRLDILRESGLEWEIRIPDMSAYYRDRLTVREGEVGSMGGYRTLEEIYLAMDSVATEHPSIVTPKWSIGQTLEGRPIYVMKVSDNPELDENEPEIYYNAAIHAREVITPELLIRFLRYLTDNYGSDPAVTQVVNSREMFFTLCQNPDGYHYNEETDPDGGGMWRKNRRDNLDGSYGIDLNRNYGYMWGYNDVGSSPDGAEEIYRGIGPFSELETDLVRNFVLSRDFSLIVAYHSYTNAIMWPWAYDCSDTPDENLLYQVGYLASRYNGYAAGHMCGINGASGDWYYSEQPGKPKIWEFLVEVGGVGDGFWPPLSRITPLVEENIMPSLIYARFAGDTSIILPPSSPVLDSIVGIVKTVPLVIHWSHADSSNPAAKYDVWRYQGYQRSTDDLETVAGNWTDEGFFRVTSNRHSGSYAYWGRNKTHCDYKVVSTRSLMVRENDSLTFWTWYDLRQGWNYAYVEVQSGSPNWIPIAGAITTTDNPNGVNLGNGITGTSDGWIRAAFDLSDYVGKALTVRFR